MQPKIIEVKQSTMLGPGNAPVPVLNVLWTYGTFGPFTLVTNWEELNQGKVQMELQRLANLLGALPTT